MYFSKSAYVRARSCPKAAWIHRYRPELVPADENAWARIQAGLEVGELARGLFGPSVNVTAENPDGTLDLGQMILDTEREMARGTPVICEAAFSFEGLYCAVDLLRREGDGWAVYEVKSSSDGFQEKYVADVAYQQYVLEHCGVKVTGVYLVCIDTSYVLEASGLDLSRLFRINDLREPAAAETARVPEVLRVAEQVLASETEPETEFAEGCGDCAFFGYCRRNLPSPNVFDLYRLPMKKKLEYYRQGLAGFGELERAGVVKNPVQLRQIDFALRDRGTYAEPGPLREFLEGLRYPLYFLDFETFQAVVPFCVGTRPFAQIPFQYSLHYIEREGGELRHAEFLADGAGDPRRALAEALCRDIPADACVTAFNKAFECGRLRELAEAFPDLSGHLLAVEGHITDLLDPFRKGWYYNRAMGGSFSIKSVLPALCPDDPELDYHRLEGVHNGTEAMSVYALMRHAQQPEVREKMRRNLLAYCRLDTLAMVKVWEALRRAAGMAEEQKGFPDWRVNAYDHDA